MKFGYNCSIAVLFYEKTDRNHCGTWDGRKHVLYYNCVHLPSAWKNALPGRGGEGGWFKLFKTKTHVWPSFTMLGWLNGGSEWSVMLRLNVLHQGGRGDPVCICCNRSFACTLSSGLAFPFLKKSWMIKVISFPSSRVTVRHFDSPLSHPKISIE